MYLDQDSKMLSLLRRLRIKRTEGEANRAEAARPPTALESRSCSLGLDVEIEREQSQAVDPLPFDLHDVVSCEFPQPQGLLLPSLAAQATW